MNRFIEELRWRGMLHDMTPGVEEMLASGPATGYIGFDPTAPSMTIGNLVQIMILKHFQLTGNRPIVLMGGATGRIGDPSFKEKERELKSYDELDNNLAFQVTQMHKFLDFSGENACILVNNLDFYKNMNVLDFLRDVGKTLTVSYMMAKDSVKNRLETGLSFTEFSYQLLQSYDFQILYDTYACNLQMGGSDQWGNITSGTEFIRRNIDGKAYALTTPLLTKADGTKFGKSEQGNIWLDPNLTSPYKFYQFWIDADDADIKKFFRYFSLKSREEIEQLETQYSEDPRTLKRILAEELTTRIHSDEDCKNVQLVTELLFGKSSGNINSITLPQIEMICQEIPTVILQKNQLNPSKNIVDILVESNILSSKTEARKAIQNNAISINKEKISDTEFGLSAESLLHGTYTFIENGKKNKFIAIWK
ncbi:MAG: tyrosine--tRNA ligase [Saprospiraceae bacterium]